MAQSTLDPESARYQAHKLSLETFNLAKDMVAGVGEAPANLARVQALKDRCAALRRRTDSADPDAQRYLSEADLDLDYLLRGQRGPLSVRLSLYIQERGAAKP